MYILVLDFLLFIVNFAMSVIRKSVIHCYIFSCFYIKHVADKSLKPVAEIKQKHASLFTKFDLRKQP